MNELPSWTMTTNTDMLKKLEDYMTTEGAKSMAITYSIDGGADGAKFNINASSGELTFKTAPNFEAPGDANQDNVYEVVVKATDPQGLSTTQTIRVTVTDVSEGVPPQITSAAAVTVAENTTRVLTVTAIDPDADGGTPPSTGTIPMSFNDPIFIGMTERTSTITLSKGQNQTKLSIQETSGNPSITANGNNVIDTCRVRSREAYRVGGSGTFDIRRSYLEANGSGDDHADTIQAYSPGSRGTIIVRDSTIKLGMTAVNCGLFVADNWTGTIDLQNVIFTGGLYGLRCHPDTGGDNIIRLKDVFFVPPFAYGPMMFTDVGGHKNIFELWENVRNATIENGILVPGSVIPKPNAAILEAMAEEAKRHPVKKTRC